MVSERVSQILFLCGFLVGDVEAPHIIVLRLRTNGAGASHRWCGGLNTLLYIDDKGTNYLQIQKEKDVSLLQ